MSGQELALGTIFTANIADFLSGTRRIRSEVNRFATASGQLNTKLKDLNSTVNKHVSQTNAAEKATEKVTKAQREQGKQISVIEGGWNRLNAAMKVTASYGVAASLIYGFISALKSGTTEIVDFDQALMNIQAITGATNAELEIMSETIVDVAKRTKYSATEVAEGMVLLGQAGFSATESINAIGAVSDLASGTLSNLRDTTDLLTSTIRAFNMDATESGRVADVMASAINKSKLTIDKLRIAFNYVGATAHQVGLTLEETAASMMVLANNGLRASTIGTGLRQVLSKLMAPTEKIKDAFEEYGISLEEINPSIVGFQTAMKNLKTVLVDDSGVVNMTKAFELFKLRGAQAAAIVSSAFTDGSFQEALDKAYEVGSAEEMMQKQSEGLAFKFKNLTDRAKNLAISLGKAGVSGVLETFADIMREVVGLVTDFTDNTIGKTIIQMGVWTTVIYGVGAALRALVVVIKGSALVVYIHELILGFRMLASVMGSAAASFTVLKTLLMGNIWFVVASAITGVGVALYHFSKRAERARKAQEKLTAETKQTADSLKLYREAIEQTKGEGREYQSLLKRLKKDHPELAKLVDLNADSHKKLTEAMREVEDENRDKSLFSQIEEIKLLNEQLEKTKRNYDYYSTNYGTMLVGGYINTSSMDDFLKNSKEGADVLEKISTKYVGFARKIYDSLEPDKKNTASDVAESFLKKNGFDEKEIELTLEKINKHFETFEKNRKKAAENKVGRFAGSEEFSNKQLAQQKKFHQLMAQMEDNQQEKIEQKYKKRAVDIEKWYKDEMAMLEKAGQASMVADKEYDDLKKQNKKKYQQELAQLELESTKRSIELSRLEIEKKMEMEKQSSIGNSQKISDIKKSELQAQNQHLQQIEQAYKKHYDKVVELFGAESKEAVQAKQKWIQKSIDLEKNLTKQTANEIRQRKKDAQLELDTITESIKLKKLEAQQQIEVEKQASVGNAERLEDIKKREKAVQLTYLSEIKQAYQDYYNQVAQLYGAESVEAIEAKQRWVQSIIAYEKVLTGKISDETKKRIRDQIDSLKSQLISVEKFSDEWHAIVKKLYQLNGITQEEYARKTVSAYKKMFDEIEKGYRSGIRSAEEYVEAINNALKKQIVTEEEANEKKIAATGTWVERFKHGIRQAKSETQSWGEFTINISRNVAGQLSNNLTSGLIDFVEGTKSAKDAFADFAKSTIKWLAEMIIKQTIFNSIIGALPGLGGQSSTPSSQVPSSIPPNTAWLADGGWITETILGKGLRSGRQYVLGEAGPELVTPANKVADLSGGSKKVEIQFNLVNESGQNMKVSNSQQRFDGKKWVVSVFLGAYKQNYMGLRSAIG